MFSNLDQDEVYKNDVIKFVIDFVIVFSGFLHQ